ncbi:MAG: flagellar biosynthesis protein FlhF, partial [Arenicella sp.]
MKIRRFFGKDMREALKQVKDELGGDAVIMSNKKVADGVELVAAVDKETEMTKPAPKISLGKRSKNTPTLSEIIGDDGPDSLKALLEKQQAGQLADDSSDGFDSVAQANANIAKRSEKEPHRYPAQRLEPIVSKTYADSEQADKRRKEAELTNQYVRTPVNNLNDDFALPFDSAQHSNFAQQSDLTETQVSDLVNQNGSLQSNDELNSIKSELASIRNVLQFQVNGLSEEKNKRKNPTHYFLGNKL